MSLPIKQRDPALMALIAAHPVKRAIVKVAKPKARGPIVMSRRAAAPIKSKVTIGFSDKSLRDR